MTTDQQEITDQATPDQKRVDASEPVSETSKSAETTEQPISSATPDLPTPVGDAPDEPAIEEVEELSATEPQESPSEEEPVSEAEPPIAEEPVAEDEPQTPSLPADDPVESPLSEPTPEEMPGADVPGMEASGTESSSEEIPDVESSSVETSEGDADSETSSAQPSEQAAFDQHMQETSDLALAEETPHTDYSTFTKQDFVALLESQLGQLRAKTAPSAQDFKRIDALLREIKPLVDQLKADDRQQALERHEAEASAKEGEEASEFFYRADALLQKFDSLYGQLRGERNRFFQSLDKQKDDNFKQKTELLARLRTLVEADEQDAASDKNWHEFKRIQEQWKAAGNMASVHNDTLWKTYHALVDRYFSNRDIYFELKELDRKRNVQQKTELCEKIEKLALQTAETPVTGQVLDEASALFEEFKHIGPAARDINEALWQRFKAAMDTIYGKKREQLGSAREQAEEVFQRKAEIGTLAETFTAFHSTSINEWNDKTKAVLALQDQWNAIKGSMPREKGREVSQKFWGDVKSFFRHKGEFFKQLEAKRAENLVAKIALCEEVEGLLASGEQSKEATDHVIDIQRRWKGIGHVPERQRDKIFDRFKAACDAFFNRKRVKSADTEKQFEENLRRKLELCEQIETEAKAGTPDVERLNGFKSQWAEIGFVPRKDMQGIQQRYIRAINQYVSAIGKLSTKEREQLVLESEVELVREEGGDDRNLMRRENDIRRRIQTLENDISLTRNNLEFFGRSKNADKLRADFEKKIAASERELEQLKHQLKVVRQA